MRIRIAIQYSVPDATRPARSPTGDGEIAIRPVRAPKERFSAKQWWVAFVCVVTIALWCVAHSIQDVIGDMGVIAIIPIVAFFSTGVLKKVRALPFRLAL